MAFAKRLMNECAPGEACVSAAIGNTITSRTALDDRSAEDPRTLRGAAWAALQWSLLLGYLLGWFYLIYWKFEYYSRNGEYPCWPQWMCG